MLVEDPTNASVRRIAMEAASAGAAEVTGTDGGAVAGAGSGSLWIAPCPVSIKLRLFCLPYAGGVSENVFCR